MVQVQFFVVKKDFYVFKLRFLLPLSSFSSLSNSD